MTNLNDEGFSSFFDGELVGEEKESMLNRLCSDEQLKHRWKRYQLVSDSLRNNLPPAIDLEFSASVMKAIDSEPALAGAGNIISHPSLFNTPTMKRMAGFAIAASVAAVAVLSFQFNYQQQQQTSSMAHAELQNTVTPANSMAQLAANKRQTPVQTLNQQQLAVTAKTPRMVQGSPAGAMKKRPSNAVSAHNPRFNAQLHKYLINHNQHFSGTKLQGVMPYARIVSSPSSSAPQGQK